MNQMAFKKRVDIIVIWAGSNSEGFAQDVAKHWANGGEVSYELLQKARGFVDDYLRQDAGLGAGKIGKLKA